jgi:hypothetical protein
METILFESKMIPAKITYSAKTNLVTIHSWGDQTHEKGFKELFETFISAYPLEKHANLLIIFV